MVDPARLGGRQGADDVAASADSQDQRAARPGQQELGVAQDYLRGASGPAF